MKPATAPTQWAESRVLAGFAPTALLASQPWDWVAPLLRQISEWLASDAVRELPANAGLFLITGGLSILTLIVSLVFLQSVLPIRAGGPIALDNKPAERSLRPLRGPTGFVPVTTPKGKPLYFHPIDALLESMVASALGEPRIIQASSSATRLRLYACRGCQNPLPEGVQPGCVRELRAIDAAFYNYHQRSVKTQEVRCRHAGHPVCEFEVRH